MVERLKSLKVKRPSKFASEIRNRDIKILKIKKSMKEIELMVKDILRDLNA